MQHKDFATKEEELKVMRFYQNDLNSAKLLINVTHDKVVTDFSTATKVQIAFLKPDGKRVFQDVQNVNQMQGKYYVVLSTQTLIAYGNVVAQLRLTFPDNKVIETCKFVFAVDESIMSDEAMKSTNEFPVIQKAIEVGETFTGVDFAPIIKAGELAAGALPKSGGTMTGNIDMDTSVGSKSKGYRWRDAAGTMYGLETSTTGELILYDYKSAARVWQYDPVGKRFSVISDGNVLKTTGGTMTGKITLTSGAMIRQEMPNAPSARGILYIDETSNAAVGGIGYARGNSGVVGEAYMGWGSAPWDAPTALIVSDTKFTYKNKPVAMRDKDGRADLVLTADAINFDTSFLPVADRRGNTVTISGAIALKTGSVENLVTTLPVDMRPVTTLSRHYLATDGTSVHVVFNIDGTVRLGVNGKNVYITETFVVN